MGVLPSGFLPVVALLFGAIAFIFGIDAQAVDLTKVMLPREESMYGSFIKSTESIEDAYVAIFRLIQPYVDRQDYEGSADILRRYKAVIINRDPEFDRMRLDIPIRLLEQPDEEQAKLIPLALDEINTKGQENQPVISVRDQQTYLYFTGSGRSRANRSADIYVARFDNAKTRWGRPGSIGFNSDAQEEISSIGKSGTFMILCRHGPKTLKGDLYYSNLASAGWDKPKPFPNGINSEHYEGYGTISESGTVLIFVSDRPGKHEHHPKGSKFHGDYWGNSDIYISYISTFNQIWSTPQPISRVINTPFAETSPFLTRDGKTLYFSSDGHPGLGRLDVFKCERLSDSSWTDWSEPINLGRHINSPGNDFGYSIFKHDSEFVAYYASTQVRGPGNLDLFTVELAKAYSPLQGDSIMKGIVLDDEGHPIGDAIVEAHYMTSGDLVSRTKTDLLGEFILPVPEYDEVLLTAESDGYLPTATKPVFTSRTTKVPGHNEESHRSGESYATLSGSTGKIENSGTRSGNRPRKNRAYDPQNSATKAATSASEARMGSGGQISKEVAIELQSIESAVCGQGFGDFNTIYFDFDSSSIKKEFESELIALSNTLCSNNWNIVLFGHTDSVGTTEYNQHLSAKRSQAVKSYLMSVGCRNLTITIDARGEFEPISSNNTDLGRASNRRVVFCVVRDYP